MNGILALYNAMFVTILIWHDNLSTSLFGLCFKYCYFFFQVCPIYQIWISKLDYFEVRLFVVTMIVRDIACTITINFISSSVLRDRGLINEVLRNILKEQNCGKICHKTLKYRVKFDNAKLISFNYQT